MYVPGPKLIRSYKIHYFWRNNVLFLPTGILGDFKKLYLIVLGMNVQENAIAFRHVT